MAAAADQADGAIDRLDVMSPQRALAMRALDSGEANDVGG